MTDNTFDYEEGSFDKNNQLTDNGSASAGDRMYESSDEDYMHQSVEELIDDSFSSQASELGNQEHWNGEKRAYYGPEKLSRKRQKTPGRWIRNVTKNANNKGEAYVSSFTKKYVPAREMKEGCGPGCENECETFISEEKRRGIFTEFWTGTTDQSAKYNYILRFVHEELKTSNTENTTRRMFTRNYQLRVDNKDVKVCKIMFLSTLNISAQMVETTLKKSRRGDAKPRDQRGTSKIRPREVYPDKTKSVIEHINLFPTVESHFTRASSQRKYLEEDLCISAMYRLYKEWAKENNKMVATFHHYNDIFNNQFNLGFFKPKKDLCDPCEGYANASDAEKEKLKTKYDLHMFNRDESRRRKKLEADLAPKETTSCMICFDFKKVLVTPKTEASCMYYKRKLSVYNFTIYEVGSHQGVCYVWSEHEANRGSCEVASCLLHFIEKRVNEGIVNFTCYADNCAGQNKNKMVFVMLAYASVKFNVNIKLTFLETGHTQNEGDAVHATIEQYARKRKVYSEHKWCDIIRNAKRTGHKYIVINVQYHMIFNFKDLTNNTNWKKTTNKNNKESSKPVSVSTIKQVTVSHEFPNQLKYKTAFDLEFETLILRKEKAHVNLGKYVLNKLYTGQQGIKAAKLKDMLELCNKYIIPQQHHDYYKSLTVKIQDENESVAMDAGEEN